MTTLIERQDPFWSQAIPEPNSGCWLWAGRWAGGRDKYGQYQFNGVRRLAHRAAYEIAHGPIPDGLWVLHRCDVPRCVNPDHLFLGTPADNMADMWRKGRGRQKLTAADLQAIRALRAEGVVLREIGERFGVGESRVWQITSGRFVHHDIRVKQRALRERVPR